MAEAIGLVAGFMLVLAVGWAVFGRWFDEVADRWFGE